MKKQSRSAVKVFSIILGLTSLAGCQSATQQDSEDRAPRACFRVNDVYSWKVIDRKTMIVYAPNRKTAYKVNFFGSCHGINFAEELAFHTHGGDRICGSAGDEIIIPRDDEHCSINNVTRLSDADLEILTNPEIDPDIGKMPDD